MLIGQVISVPDCWTVVEDQDPTVTDGAGHYDLSAVLERTPATTVNLYSQPGTTGTEPA